uniref:Uncharacterized protein n=1 Tax=Arundo donax TaxID=35708 RepID=A0A0A9B8F7_ARUDO
MRIAHFDDHVSPVSGRVSYLHIVPSPLCALLRLALMSYLHVTPSPAHALLRFAHLLTFVFVHLAC